MPIVNIRVTDEGVTLEQKKKLIEGATKLLVDVLDKDPKTTFVVIEEIGLDNWGFNSETVRVLRQREKEITQ